MTSNRSFPQGNALQVAGGAEMAQRPAGERWYRRVSAASPSVRLFCFPYAGGNARMFREWHSWCGPEVEVIAVELPGHGFHSRIPVVDRMDTMVERALAALTPLMDVPFAMFGHSMGALIAFELCRALSARGHKTPMHLFASGMRAPHLRGERLIYDLPDAQFMEALRYLNGTPAEILEDKNLMEIFLPLLRADLRLAETYQYMPGPPLQHPISVFCGLNDVTAPTEHLREWRRHTRGGCTVRLLEGDHFFIQQQAHLMAASILRSLGRVPMQVAFAPAARPEAAEITSREQEPVFSGAD
jgi:medium-chain acyl-[acyl-carrier-protein] hydrolase